MEDRFRWDGWGHLADKMIGFDLVIWPHQYARHTNWEKVSVDSRRFLRGFFPQNASRTTNWASIFIKSFRQNFADRCRSNQISSSAGWISCSRLRCWILTRNFCERREKERLVRFYWHKSSKNLGAFRFLMANWLVLFFLFSPLVAGLNVYGPFAHRVIVGRRTANSSTLLTAGSVVTLQNRAAMNTRLRVLFTDANGNPSILESGRLLLGQTKSVHLPANVQHVRILIEKDIFFEHWRVAYNGTLTSGNQCLRIVGVTFHSKIRSCNWHLKIQQDSLCVLFSLSLSLHSSIE